MNKTIIDQLGIDIEKLLEAPSAATEDASFEAQLSAEPEGSSATALLQVNVAEEINAAAKLSSALELLSKKFKAITILLDMSLALLTYRIILPYMPEEQLKNIIIRRKLEWLNTNMPTIRKNKISCSIVTDEEQSLLEAKEDNILKINRFMQHDHTFFKNMIADAELLKNELSVAHNISKAMYNQAQHKNDNFIELYLVSRIATIAALCASKSSSKHSYIALTKMQSYNYLQKSEVMPDLPTYITLNFITSIRDDSKKVLTSLELNQKLHEIDLLGKISARQLYLENSVNNFPGNVYIESLNGTFIRCNHQQALALGVPSKTYFEGQDIANLFPEGDAKSIIDTVDNIITTNRTQLLIEDHTYGKKVPYLSIKMPLRNKKNTPIGVLGFSMKIEDQAEAKKLKNLENGEEEKMDLMQTIVSDHRNSDNEAYDTSYMENMIEHMPGHVFWQDTNGKILGCNQNQAEFMGFSSPKSIIGKHVSEFLTDEDAEEAVTSLKTIVTTGEPTIQQETYKSGDNLLVMASHKTPVKDDKGKVIGVMVVALEAEQDRNREIIIEQEKAQLSKAIDFKNSIIKAIKDDLQYPFANLLKMVQKCESGETDLEKKQELSEILNRAKDLVDFSKNIMTEAGDD